MVNQAYALKTIRNAAILTNSYVAADILWQENLQAEDNNQLILHVYATLWSLTSIQLKVEFADQDVSTEYVQETIDSISWGTITENLSERDITADWSYRIAIPMKERYAKVSAKWTGTVTSSSLRIKWIIATA